MRMAFHHQHLGSPRNHPIRTLVFVVIVIIIAMMVSALTFLRTNPVSVTQSPDAGFFSAVALHVTDGEEVFNRVCTTCHTIDRPTDVEREPIAPPMKMIAQRYIRMTESSKDASTTEILMRGEVKATSTESPRLVDSPDPKRKG